MNTPSRSLSASSTTDTVDGPKLIGAIAQRVQRQLVVQRDVFEWLGEWV
jgi:hypothetical protein